MNRHAAEAMERDSARKESERAAREQKKDDDLWAETDARTLKKAEREKEALEKAKEQERRRAESKAQLDEEERAVDKSKVPSKVSKKMMQRDVAKLVASYDAEVAKVRGHGAPEPPSKNFQEAVASGVDECIRALEPQGEVLDGRHIGKRARVLYKRFCDENRASLKESHNGLKFSQVNDLLWEMWQKSPQNPFVVRKEARDAERLAEERRWMEDADSEEEQ